MNKTYRRSSAAFALCSLLLLLLAACARPGPSQQDRAAASAVLSRYRQISQAAEKSVPQASAHMSIRAGKNTAEGAESRRVTALLWGNSEKGSPVRLDVMAGVGASVAHVRESEEGLVLYLPRDNRAYFCPSGQSRQALGKLNVPIPLKLAGLSALLQGRFGDVFLPDPKKQASLLADGGVSTALVPGEGRLGGTLFLTAGGIPFRWADPSSGWTMELGYDSESRLPQPKRIEAKGSDSRFAIVIVKLRETPPAPYSPKQTDLAVPADTVWDSLIDTQHGPSL